MALTKEERAALNAEMGRTPGAPSQPVAEAGGQISDIISPERTIHLTDGRTVPLKPLTLRDLAVIEKEFGSIDTFFGAIASGRIAEVCYLFWLLIRRPIPGITVEEASDLVSVTDLQRLAGEALAVAGIEVESGNGEAAPANP